MNNLKKRILIIDDDQDLLEMYGYKFLQADFEVEKAENGAWGLKKIQSEKFDVVLLDMSMPAMNGLEMLRAIKKEKGKSNCPKIIVLSNTALEDEIREMKKAGADKCFTKIQVTPADICQEAINTICR